MTRRTNDAQHLWPSSQDVAADADVAAAAAGDATVVAAAAAAAVGVDYACSRIRRLPPNS